MIMGGCCCGAGCCTMVVCGSGVGCSAVRATLAFVVSSVCRLIRNRNKIVTRATAAITKAATKPPDIPDRSGTRAVSVRTTSRRALGVSTTTRLFLVCSSSYAICLFSCVQDFELPRSYRVGPAAAPRRLDRYNRVAPINTGGGDADKSEPFACTDTNYRLQPPLQ